MIGENTHIPSLRWSTRKERIECYLKDSGEVKPVEVSISESDTGILDLKAINCFGEPRENFDSLSTDIGEHFKRGHGDSPYTDYTGLFCHSIQ